NCLTCYTPALFPPAAEFQAAIEKKFPAFRALENLPAALSGFTLDAAYTAYKASKLPGAVRATMARPNVLRTAANRPNASTVPTMLMRDLFVENGINPKLIHHVPFGIDTAPLEAHQKKTSSDVIRFGFIGTLFEHKGVDLLIRAFLDLPQDVNARLHIYGDPRQFPDYASGLMKLADNGSVNSSKITFEGTFPNAELGRVLSNLDVLVVPSRWYENTPLVIQSSLATKTPVIATNLGGMSELIKHNINGL